jgi:signal transduction histidine kinase
MMRHCRRRSAPPWWPAGEPWPPPDRRFGPHGDARASFFRRIAFAFAALLLLAMFGGFAVAWLVANRFGFSGWAPVPIAVVVLLAIGAVLRARGAMGHFTSPLHAVMDGADRVAGGDYTVRVAEHGPPVMRAMTHSFNTMAERLQNADRQRRDLMADVAHELRTPLTVLQGRLEGLIDGVYPREDGQLVQLLEQTHVLSRLVDDLRTLALSDAGVLELHREPTDLVSLAKDVARSFEREAADRAVAVEVAEPMGPIVLDLDPIRVREVLANLVSNALRHSKSGSSVTIAPTATDAEARIDVKDRGDGIPAEQVARMFDRFYKGPESRGSGLGLAIAKQLVESHGGQISATSSIGRGTTVTVTLPRRQP